MPNGVPEGHGPLYAPCSALEDRTRLLIPGRGW